MPRGDKNKHTLGAPARGENIRPFASGVTSDRPECHSCTWVPKGKRWALKFVNRSCGKHRSLL